MVAGVHVYSCPHGVSPASPAQHLALLGGWLQQVTAYSDSFGKKCVVLHAKKKKKYSALIVSRATNDSARWTYAAQS